MEWKVVNALNRDVERQHLNKILKDIRETIDSISIESGSPVSDVRDQVGEMVSNNREVGIDVTYDPRRKVLDFAVARLGIQLTGEVTGSAFTDSLGTITINTTIDPAARGIGDAPVDGYAYWRRSGDWDQVGEQLETLSALEGPGFTALDSMNKWNMRELEGVEDEVVITNPTGDEGNPTFGLADIADSGEGSLLAITRDSKGRVTGTREATITGTAGEIDVADGDASEGLPTLSLADVSVTSGGTLQKYGFDAKGRRVEEEAADTDDLDEGSNNLYFTDARAQEAVADILDGTGDVEIHYEDTPDPRIYAELSAGVQASLALADTALQPGDNISALTNDAGYLTDAPIDGNTYGRKDGAWEQITTSGSGTVTSVGLSVPTGLQVSGSPVTTSGTLTVTYATGYQGYTSAEASKLSGIASGATVGADWSVNLSNIPANISSWAGIAPSDKADTTALADYLPLAGGTMAGAVSFPNDSVAMETPGGAKMLTGTLGYTWLMRAGSAGGNALATQRVDGTTTMVVGDDGITWEGNYVWHAGNFNPATKANDSDVVKTSGNQTGLSGNKTWTSGHQFGAVTVAGSNYVIYNPGGGNAHLWFRDADNSTVRGLLYSDGTTRNIALRAYAIGGSYTQLVGNPSNNSWQIDGSEVWRTSNFDLASTGLNGATAPIVADADAVIGTNTRFFRGTTGSTGFPTPNVAALYLPWSNAAGAMIAFQPTAQSFYFRTQPVSGGWNPWQEVWTTNNLANTNWATPTLGANWSGTNHGYKRFGFHVAIRGQITNTGGSRSAGTVIFTLPSGFRPSADMVFVMHYEPTGGGPAVNFKIGIPTSGAVTLAEPLPGGATLYMSGLSFYVN